MKLLLVDDDYGLAEVTAFALRREGYLVITAHDGVQALECWASESPDLILLDVQMPRKDGLATCRDVRNQSDVPIILLTVRATDDDVVRGFALGADDYVTKPFSPRQLIARIQAILRRRSPVPQGRLQAGELILDPEHLVAAIGAATIRLTRLEYRLLHYLLVNQGQIIPTEAILAYVWGYAEGDRRLLKQLIFRLRQKLESGDAGQQYIETVPGVGYSIPRI
jgi:DNA-binding response OmpR family regulator